jgi:hypothetical protein
MPATSQQQQKLFGLALAVKRGEVPAFEVSDEVKDIVDRMSEKDIEDFAGTKHAGLPKKVEVQLKEIVREIMRERVIAEMEQSVNEGVSVFDERYFGKKGIIIMIDDNGKKVSAIFKDKKNADKYNRNKQSDIEALLKIAKTKPFGKAIDESVNEGKKVFKVNPQIGKSKYSISSHDGVKKHKDGSDFFDIETFKNKVDLEKAIKNYTSKGFKMESINEVGKGSNWAEKYVNDTDLYKKLNWYIMMGKGAEKKIKGKEFVIMSDGSALIWNTKTSDWELYKPKRIDKKTGKPIYESVNEDIEPQTKKIASLTGTRPDAVKHFVSKHALNITKLLKFIEKGKLSDRMDFVTALAGRDGNPTQKKMIKMFQESINEATPKIKNTISKKEWRKTPKFNKHIGQDGTHYLMKYDDKIGTYLQAVNVVDESVSEALKADPRKVYGGTGAKEGMVLVRQDGFRKILDLSKKNPSNVFVVSDDNYTNFGPFYVKNGNVAKYTVANPNYDLEKNKIRSVKVPNDVILKFKVVE